MSVISAIRMCPANASAGTATAIVKGRKYSCAVGSTIDVSEADSGPLEAQGFLRLDTSGPTSQRPTYPPNANSDARVASSPIGYRYIDTTLGKAIRFNGSIWVDAATGAIV